MYTIVGVCWCLGLGILGLAVDKLEVDLKCRLAMDA